MVLLDYDKLNKKNIYIKLTSKSELDNFKNWLHNIDETQKDIYLMYGNEFVYNVFNKKKQYTNKVNSKNIVLYNEVILKDKSLEKEKKRLIKLTKELHKENKLLLTNMYEDMYEGKNNSLEYMEKININVSKLQSYVNLIH